MAANPGTSAMSVPVIDIEALESEAALAAIDAACRRWGFFQVVNHGIDASLSGALFDAARSFFVQPTAKKHEILRTRDNPWGFYDRELTKNRQDWKQVFDYGPPDGNNVPQWPRDLPGFRPAVRAWCGACETLAHRLLAAISMNLGMEKEHLAGAFDDAHTSFLRLNFYPKCPPGDRQDSAPLGIGQHTDAGALTILLQDGQPGLEVCRDGAWHLVEPTEGALVVNLGDMAQVWSNDRYVAALHRVITNTDTDRYSAPYFFNPAWDTNYAPLPTTVDENNPARYRPINWREFRTMRHAGDYADYGDEVQISDYRIE